MPSTDFDLYSSQEEKYSAMLTYGQYPVVTPGYQLTTIDLQSGMPAFSGLRPSPMYAFKQGYFLHSPAASPASGSPSFDHFPPQLSTASESIGSVQSTSPSAAGSPSVAQDLPEQQTWCVLGQGQALAVGLGGAESFSTNALKVENMVSPDHKISGCVGEYQILSPSPASTRSALPFSMTPFPTSSASGRLQSPSPRAHAFGSADQLDVAPSTPFSIPFKDDGVFKTPTAPASATVSRSPSSASSIPEFIHPKMVAAAADMHQGRRQSLLPKHAPPSGTPAEISASCASEPTGPMALTPPPIALNVSYSPMNPSYPTLIQPFPEAVSFVASSYSDLSVPSLHYQSFGDQPPSPTPSITSSHTVADSSRLSQSGSRSPYLDQRLFQPYSTYSNVRPPSVVSIQSRHSQASRRSNGSEHDEEPREKGMCPIEGCGRVFKDLKAHMLTHQAERPEKCPIITCEYHMKGFARKYDKNRHTLTHYKGTMVCGFCPGSGSAAEKSFNRADVFKRHLTSVHSVEQTPPNSRKKLPVTKREYRGSGNTGTCSTCSVTFANAQDFYEHLDECVIRVVQQAEPSNPISRKLLTSVTDDDVKSTVHDNYSSRNDSEHTSMRDDGKAMEGENRKKNKHRYDDTNDHAHGARHPKKARRVNGSH